MLCGTYYLVEKILHHVIILFPERQQQCNNALDARSIEKEEAFATECKGLIAFPCLYVSAA